MEGILKDLSFVGKTTSKIGLVIGVVIGVILLYFSYNFFTKTDEFIKVTGTIKNVKQCNERTEVNAKVRTGTLKTNNFYDCIITVEYTVDNKVYVNDILTDNKINYLKYDTKTLDISYNPTRPDEIKLPGIPNTTLAFIFLASAIVIMGISYYSYYLAENSTVAATAQGVNSVASMFGFNNNNQRSRIFIN
jgi:hypothetical protein